MSDIFKRASFFFSSPLFFAFIVGGSGLNTKALDDCELKTYMLPCFRVHNWETRRKEAILHQNGSETHDTVVQTLIWGRDFLAEGVRGWSMERENRSVVDFLVSCHEMEL